MKDKELIELIKIDYPGFYKLCGDDVDKMLLQAIASLRLRGFLNDKK